MKGLGFDELKQVIAKDTSPVHTSIFVFSSIPLQRNKQTNKQKTSVSAYYDKHFYIKNLSFVIAKKRPAVYIILVSVLVSQLVWLFPTVAVLIVLLHSISSIRQTLAVF